MLITDERNRIVACNRAYSKLCGYAAEQLVEETPSLLKSGRHGRDFYEGLWAQLNAAGSWSGEIWNRHRNGRVFAAQVSISAVEVGGDKATHYLAVMEDITARKRQEERARRAQFADPLTGLPNQTLFLDRLNRGCARHRRDKRPAAVGLVNIDGFKTINDSFGFDAGDELLREMTLRLKDCLRDSDTVARLDGDQFGVLLPDLAQQQDVALIAKKMLSRLSDTYTLGYHQRAFVTVGIGLAILPGDGAEATDLMRAAETALRHAKGAGRNMYRFYGKEMNAAALQRLHLERDLHDALHSHQFELHFHPIIGANDSTLTGAEALIRWNRPGHGLVSPAEFLPLAEETGLIVPIGDWVLQEVVDTLIAGKQAGAPPLRISVNISPRQLRDSDVFERMQQRMQGAGISPTCLELELSESALQAITSKEEGVLQKISGFGIDLSIDNYGTGYTSLQQLRKVPVKTLKIDKLFIRNMGADQDEAALTDAILAMARSLGIRTVAEGVETTDQWSFMRERDCDFGQGFLFSKPLTKSEFLAFAKEYYSKAS